MRSHDPGAVPTGSAVRHPQTPAAQECGPVSISHLSAAAPRLTSTSLTEALPGPATPSRDYGWPALVTDIVLQTGAVPAAARWKSNNAFRQRLSATPRERIARQAS